MTHKQPRTVLDADREWTIVERLLPPQWQQKAKPLGALRRTRAIADPGILLRILLMHLAEGCTLKESALRAEELGWADLSPVAVFKRLRAAGRWLAWMAHQLYGKTYPRVAGRECLAVDATTVCEAGASGRLWRVHWSVNLANLQCEFFEVTDASGGEKFARFPIDEGQLVMGDRGYSTAGGIDYVRQRGGHVLVRVNPAALPLYARREGERIDVLTYLRKMEVGEIREWATLVQGPAGRWHRGRLVAVRRSKASALRELRRLRQKAQDNGRKLSRRVKRLARYILVWTSLPREELSCREVLKHYRLRWQLELVFKRAKSIMGLGQLPKRSDASSRAWVNGKMLVAMLVEKLWQEAESFSPWGYGIAEPALPLAGDSVSVSGIARRSDPVSGSKRRASQLGRDSRSPGPRGSQTDS